MPWSPRTPIRITVLVFLTAVFVAAGRARADTFSSTHEATAARNHAGIGFRLRTEGDRTDFAIGEAMSLTVEYRSALTGWALVDPAEAPESDFAGCGVAIDHTDGVIEDLRPAGYFYSGPGTPPPTALDKGPQTRSFVLNSDRRFTKPGTYRIYVTSSEVIDTRAAKADKDGCYAPGPPLTSNLVTIHILPRDPKWERAQYDAAVHAIETASVWDVANENQVAPYSALNSLTQLGTHDAAKVLLGRLAANNEPGWSGNDGFLCELGLERFLDRPWILKEMRRDLNDPAYAVSIDFLRTYGTLLYIEAHAMRGNHEVETTLPDFWQQAIDAARKKTPGRTQAVTWYSLAVLYHDFTANEFRNPRMAKQLPTIRAEVIATFDDLPIQPRAMLLDLYWDWLRGPDVLPALRRFKAKTPDPFPNRADRGLLDRRIGNSQPALELAGRRLFHRPAAASRRATISQLC